MQIYLYISSTLRKYQKLVHVEVFLKMMLAFMEVE